MHLARRATLPGALAVAALALATGCTATNPTATTLVSDPADGQDLSLGAIRVADLLVVSDPDYAGTGAGNLVARLVNQASSARRVTITDRSGSGVDETFSVPGGQTLAIGPDETHRVRLADVGEAAGKLVTLRIAVEGGASRDTAVPVLTGTIPEYRSLEPTATPTTAPSPTDGAGAGTAGQTASAVVSGATPTTTTTPPDAGGGSPGQSSDVPEYSPSGTPTG